MNSVLKIKDKVTGKWIDIPAIKGGDGKSAYEQAVEGGFQGTEEEFINLLGSLEGVEFTHLIDKNNPHETTAEQTGAISKTIGINSKDVLNIKEDGLYYGVGLQNVPTETTYGYVLVRTTSDTDNYRMVTWRPANSSVEYTNVLSNGKWLGWTETFTNKGGLITGNLHYKNDLCGLAGDGNYIGFNAGDDGNNLRAIHLRRPSADANIGTALVFANVIKGDGTNYKIFGEHNQPFQTLNATEVTPIKNNEICWIYS